MADSHATNLYVESEAYEELRSIGTELKAVREELELFTNSAGRRRELKVDYDQLEAEWELAFQRYVDAHSRFAAQVRTLLH